LADETVGGAEALYDPVGIIVRLALEPRRLNAPLAHSLSIAETEIGDALTGSNQLAVNRL